MSMRAIPCCANLTALAFLVLAPLPAAAAWPTNPNINVPACVAGGAQGYAGAAADSAGGILVAWDDQRSGPRDIYAQRIDFDGRPRWTTDGVALCTAPNEQYEPVLVPDGAGGAIVTWVDYRNGTAYDIYVQRVSAVGAPMWAANGVALCSATGFQEHPAVIPDGSGGAIVTWDDARVGNNRMYAQRVNSSGTPQWTANGVLLSNSLAGQNRAAIVSDGAGGAIVTWQDFRNGEVDFFAQHVRANGTLDPAWPAGGLAVSLYVGDQEGLGMASDGNGGALVAWAQWVGGLRDIYVKHVLATGGLDPTWPPAGRAMLVDFPDQASPAIVSDGAGGAILCWDDLFRGDGRDVYAQHVLASGALDPAWPAAGRALSLAAGDQVSPRIVADGSGGALVLWRDTRTDVGDIYAQHVLNTGGLDPAWPADGRAICSAGQMQILPTLVPDGVGGAVVGWQDLRSDPVNGEDSDIYVQRVKGNGQLGEEPVGVEDDARVELALESPSPNPSRSGSLVMRFTLPSAAAASLELYDVTGRRIAAREVGSLGAGPHAVDLTAGRRPGAGIYFVRLSQGGTTRVRHVVLLDE